MTNNHNPIEPSDPYALQSAHVEQIVVAGKSGTIGGVVAVVGIVLLIVSAVGSVGFFAILGALGLVGEASSLRGAPLRTLAGSRSIFISPSGSLDPDSPRPSRCTDVRRNQFLTYPISSRSSR